MDSIAQEWKMIRKTLWIAGLAIALMSSQVATAQIVPLPLPKDGVPPELQKEFEQLQKELQKVLEQAGGGQPGFDQLQKELQKALEQAGAAQPGRIQPGTNAMRWGGLQLKKVAAADQEKLGLPENEGLIVTGVDAGSVGEKAGVKANDVLVKLNGKGVPSEVTFFTKLVKDQKADEPFDLVVIRDGKEVNIKGAQMPAVVQGPTNRPGGLGGIGPVGGAGGLLIRPGGIVVPGLKINPKIRPANPNGGVQNLNLEMTVNGAKIKKKQNGDDFSGEYSKEELKISVAGKLENGLAKASEIVVVEAGKETKYKAITEVPAQHRLIVQQLMPGPAGNLNNLLGPIQGLPNIQNFPGLPVVPGLND
jgi:membrane-associated protease RseP (regulator of RpoE activity)